MGENPEADRAHFLRLYESMRSKLHENSEIRKALELSGMLAIVQIPFSASGRKEVNP